MNETAQRTSLLSLQVRSIPHDSWVPVSSLSSYPMQSICPAICQNTIDSIGHRYPDKAQIAIPDSEGRRQAPSDDWARPEWAYESLWISLPCSLSQFLFLVSESSTTSAMRQISLFSNVLLLLSELLIDLFSCWCTERIRILFHVASLCILQGYQVSTEHSIFDLFLCRIGWADSGGAYTRQLRSLRPGSGHLRSDDLHPNTSAFSSGKARCSHTNFVQNKNLQAHQFSCTACCLFEAVIHLAPQYASQPSEICLKDPDSLAWSFGSTHPQPQLRSDWALELPDRRLFQGIPFNHSDSKSCWLFSWDGLGSCQLPQTFYHRCRPSFCIYSPWRCHGEGWGCHHWTYRFCNYRSNSCNAACGSSGVLKKSDCCHWIVASP